MKNIKSYWKRIFRMRYFIWHLVKIGLKNKFRRSKLGILWTFINPLCLTAIMSVVFSAAFHYNYNDYLPYVLSGILFWDLFSSSFIAGGNTFIGYDSFIRQCNLPLTLYTLANSLLFTTSFLISLIALAIITVFISPLNVLFGMISLPFTIILFAFFSWGATTISAYIGVQYRDYPMAAQLLLQVVWYVSPVFFDESMFKGNHLIFEWFSINPVTHMLNLLREPFLHGRFPTFSDLVITISFIFIVDMIAYLENKNKERNVIFYL